MSFLEPPQADVIEEILKHCGLWQSWSPRAPPKVDELVLEVDAACSSRSIDSPGPADESQELTCVDIDSNSSPTSRCPNRFTCHDRPGAGVLFLPVRLGH